MSRPTQTDMVLDYIRTHGSITAIQADDDLGVRRLAARIRDLREDGHDITTETVTVKNRRGEDCRVARYSMAAGHGDVCERCGDAPRSDQPPTWAGGLLFNVQPYIAR